MPADYINKLARMFQDIKVSNDLNQGFKKEYKNKGDIAGTVFFWARFTVDCDETLLAILDSYKKECKNGRKAEQECWLISVNFKEGPWYIFSLISKNSEKTNKDVPGNKPNKFQEPVCK